MEANAAREPISPAEASASSPAEPSPLMVCPGTPPAEADVDAEEQVRGILRALSAPQLGGPAAQLSAACRRACDSILHYGEATGRYDALALAVARSCAGVYILAAARGLELEPGGRARSPRRGRALPRSSLATTSESASGARKEEATLVPPWERAPARSLRALVAEVPRCLLEVLAMTYSGPGSTLPRARAWGLPIQRFSQAAAVCLTMRSGDRPGTPGRAWRGYYGPDRPPRGPGAESYSVDSSGLIRGEASCDVVLVTSRLNPSECALARLMAESGHNVWLVGPLFETPYGQERVCSEYLGPIRFTGHTFRDPALNHEFGVHRGFLRTAGGSLTTSLLHSFQWFFDAASDYNRDLAAQECCVCELLHNTRTYGNQEDYCNRLFVRASVLASFMAQAFSPRGQRQGTGAPKLVVTTGGFGVLAAMSLAYQHGSQTVRALRAQEVQCSVQGGSSPAISAEEDSACQSAEYTYVSRPKMLFWAAPNQRALEDLKKDVVGAQFSDYRSVFAHIKDLQIPDTGVLDSFHPYVLYIARAAIFECDYVCANQDVLQVFRELPWLHWALGAKARPVQEGVAGMCDLAALAGQAMGG